MSAQQVTNSDGVCHSMDAHILSNWLDGPTALKPSTPSPSLPIDVLTATAPDLSDSQISKLLSAFDVDIQNGFIPTEDPLPCLDTNGRFSAWERVMSELSIRLHAHNIRSVITSLPIIEVRDNDILTPPELRRAQLVLSMLAHAYVWGEEPVLSVLPACIAVPWVTVSHRLGRVAVLTHSAIILSNWKRLDPKGPIRLHNVGLLNGFFGGIDEAIFYLVTLEVEAVGAPSLKEMIQAKHYVRTLQVQKLTDTLNKIASIQKQMTAALLLTYKDCDPYIFYTRVRSFLQGWRGNPKLPEGLTYEGVTSDPQLFHGGSAAQSCIVAVFDSFLGVGHERVQTAQFMKDMRFYMPGLHREFLKFIETNVNVRDFVEERCYGTTEDAKFGNGYEYGKGSGNGRANGVSHSNNISISSASVTTATHNNHIHIIPPSSSRPVLRDPELLAAFNNCVDELVTFRSKHINVVALYILAQAHNTKHKIPPKPYSSLPTSSSTSSLASSASHNNLLQATASPSLASSPVTPLSPVSGHGKVDMEENPEGTGVATGERGTGGTSIMPYLKTSRDETKEVRL